MPFPLSELRKEYQLNELNLADFPSSPFPKFQQWFAEVLAAGIHEPNAMHLSTVNYSGKPSGRIVLIKEIDERGFVFFTNYESQKGSDLHIHPFAALTFFWPEFERQVRIEGVIEKVSPEESDAYFQSRPRDSQLGAWASQQSRVIETRDILENRQRELEQIYAGQPIPRPPYWGGYRLLPDLVEFWQGRPSRLHDRIRYRKLDKTWITERLSP